MREEEEKDCACKDDPEILAITRKAIVANRFPSNTNLLTLAQSPVPDNWLETGNNIKTRQSRDQNEKPMAVVNTISTVT